MPFQIVRDDVTAISADAVIVPSNEQLLISGGVGGQVAAIAGCEQLQAAASAAAPCPAGHAVAVSPGSYPARCIVFATGPQWPGNPQPSALHLLQAANLAALEAAAAQGCQSIALPLISAGSFSFPARHAFACASAAVREFLARAGYALSPASPGDVIVRYFLDRGMHNIFDINEMLYRFDQQLL